MVVFGTELVVNNAEFSTRCYSNISKKKNDQLQKEIKGNYDIDINSLIDFF